MTAPVLATLFQIGVDNALIQVPQNYTVPANPPSMPNPPINLAIPTSNTQTTTTSDSVTIYLSAIKGFSNPLSMTFMVQPISVDLAASLGYVIGPEDATTASWNGLIGSTSTNWNTGSYNSDTAGWVGPLPFTMQANVITLDGSYANPLNTYTTSTYQTLWINVGGTGGSINPNHPASYLVTIYATDPITNTYSACNFTIVVMPSVANYGLGVYVMGRNFIGSDFNPFVFTNSVTIPPSGFVSGGSPDNQGALLNLYYYPLEPAPVAPSVLNISLNWFNSPIIDLTNSVIALPPSYTPIAFTDWSDSDGLNIIPSGFTRDEVSDVVSILLYLDSTATTVPGSDPVDTHALLQVQATDQNGVTISSYTAIFAQGAATS